MNSKEYLKWIMPSIENRSLTSDSLNDNFNFRIEKAKEQYQIGIQMGLKEDKEKQKQHKKEIIKYVNEFLSEIMGMEKINDPYVYPKTNTETRRISYSQICSKNELKNKKDIVWIKFTTDGIISVVGTNCDIFFTDITKENTKAGLINQKLNLEWDESVVLVFPLKNIPKELNRSDIESGIGNYLISKGVPILDFYSHNY